MARIEETAFAKINLDLRVCHRRADGYHDLDSIVVFAEAGDCLTFEEDDRLSLTVKGPFGSALPWDDGNLVIRAAKALADMVGRTADVRINLEKKLPVASGLGGGSADAAATLRGLTRFWHLPLSPADLLPLARTLGADVPVCLGSTAARMEGIGDQLTSIPSPIGLSLVLVNPGEPVSTAEVFRELQQISGTRVSGAFLKADRDFRDHIMNGVNDLEPPAVRIAPIISAVMDAIRRQPGCILARMSGSGATCFGLFEDKSKGNRALSNLRTGHPGWWVIGTDIR